jgi:hypothetical protein
MRIQQRVTRVFIHRVIAKHNRIQKGHKNPNSISYKVPATCGIYGVNWNKYEFDPILPELVHFTKKIISRGFFSPSEKPHLLKPTQQKEFEA